MIIQFIPEYIITVFQENYSYFCIFIPITLLLQFSFQNAEIGKTRKFDIVKKIVKKINKCKIETQSATRAKTKVL